jgi:hypothetical protein
MFQTLKAHHQAPNYDDGFEIPVFVSKSSAKITHAFIWEVQELNFDRKRPILTEAFRGFPRNLLTYAWNTFS